MVKQIDFFALPFRQPQLAARNTPGRSHNDSGADLSNQFIDCHFRCRSKTFDVSWHCLLA
jgi:hypothetical protein